ncbi:MAG: alpha-D-ribose 1-methylphosphonate 5-triphosphate diphosphatase [Acetobacteraceae bacterium]|nr:alpha-D-ribose 1-methylphosphonate 5-triphosphate diphosphatase [Acetobacteraceae bacterium]
MRLAITGARILLDGEAVETTLGVEDGRIAAIGGDAPRNAAVLDAAGLVLAPGIIDLHGDAFERNVQPRPGVSLPIDLAMADADAQAAAAGITTLFHGVTLSWEPGLRGGEMFSALLDALDRLRPRARVEHRVHLRMEAIAPDQAPLALEAIAAGRAHMVAVNDHTASIAKKTRDPAGAFPYARRAGVSAAEIRALAERMLAREAEGEAALARVLEAARRHGLPIASHDDESPAARARWRGEGASICEFPMNAETARAARAAGESVVMGCPNVVRGGSHLGWHSAEAMVRENLCDVLVSDYVWGAMLPAAFALAGRGVKTLPEAWALIAANPAASVGLADRGRIAVGARADLVLIDPAPPVARVVATLVEGVPRFLAAPAAGIGAAGMGMDA